MTAQSRFAPFLLLAALVLPGSAALAATPIPKPPAVDSRSYILMDYDSGRVLAEQLPDQRVEPASITKVMTVYVAFDAMREKRATMDTDVPISEKAWRQGKDSTESRMFLEVGKTAKFGDLLRGIIIQSGNDAAVALAEFLGGSEAGFAEMMNHYAQKLGMKDTHYADASGMPDPQHYTTARDIARLSQALIRDFPEQYRIFAEKEYTYHNIKQQNRNGLLWRDPTVDGIKTGHTSSAGYCLAASAKRGDMRLISVVMGTPSIKARESANAALLSYGYTFYETTKLKAKGDVIATPRVYKSEEETVPMIVPVNLFATVPRGQAASLKTTIRLNEPLVAPLAAGKAVGEITITDSTGTVVGKSALVPAKAVPQAGWWTTMIDSVALWFK